MSRLIFVLLLAVFVAAQIPEGCVDCGLPDHPNCQVCSSLVRNIYGRRKKKMYFLLSVKKLRPPPPPFLTISVFSDEDFFDVTKPPPLFGKKW